MVVESNISDALLFDRNESLNKPTYHPSKHSDKIEFWWKFLVRAWWENPLLHDEKNGILYPTLSHSSEMFEFYDGLCATLQNYTM